MDVGKRFTRAAIFGSSGGIGRALCEALVDHGVHVWAGSRSGKVHDKRQKGFCFDLRAEDTIAAVAQTMKLNPPDLVIIATGVLTLPNGKGPERSLKQIDSETMGEVFQLNTIGPALIAKHMLPLLPRENHSLFAALSARVGSISDNDLGGWHSYRASKVALNMLLRNFAIEMRRSHKHAVVAGMHPGTVDTKLSDPFQANLPAGQLTKPRDAAENLLDVMVKLRPEDSGHTFDWKGDKVPA